MSSIRLRADQITRLRRIGDSARVIAYALKRWRRGDFTIAADAGKAPRSKAGEALRVYPIWRKPEGVTDAQVRAVLDAHWATPDTVLQTQRKRELAYWDGIIAAEWAKVAASGPFIVEKQAE